MKTKIALACLGFLALFGFAYFQTHTASSQPRQVKQDYWFSTQNSGNEVMVTFCSGDSSEPSGAWCHLVAGGGGGLHGTMRD